MIGISKSGWRAVISPEDGCVIRSLTFKGINLLRPAPEGADDPLLAACYPCAPWFGRLYDGLPVNGGGIFLAPTHPACDPLHAIHGMGWVRPWTLTQQRSDALACELVYAPEEDGYPFPFIAWQCFKVSKTGLEIVLGMRNTGSSSIPAGLGLHPFFRRDRLSAIELHAQRFWTPPDVEGPAPSQFDFSARKALPAETLDHSYAGFGGEALITTGDAALLLKSDAPHVHIYAPAGEDFFCIEPITQLPGALSHNLLAPEATLSLNLKITLA